jgi:DNA-binding NarL/FixJ family response regulator
MSSVRVLVCASKTLSDAINQALDRVDEFEVATCPTQDTAILIHFGREFRPNIVLLEKSATLQPTLAALQLLRTELSTTKVVILAPDTMTMLHARELLDEGAKAYLLTSCITDDLMTSLRLVASGKIVICPPVAQSLFTAPR